MNFKSLITIVMMSPTLWLLSCGSRSPVDSTNTVSIAWSEDLDHGFAWTIQCAEPVYLMHKFVDAFQFLPVDKDGVWNWINTKEKAYKLSVESREHTPTESTYPLRVEASIWASGGRDAGQIFPSLGRLIHSENLAYQSQFPVDRPIAICVWTYRNGSTRNVRVLYLLARTEEIAP